MNEHAATHKSSFEAAVELNLRYLKQHPDLPQPRLRYMTFQNHEFAHHHTDRESALAFVTAAKGTAYPVTEVYDLTHSMQAQLDTPGVWRL